MKKTIILAALLAAGTAVTSQAVVIHWAVTESLDDATTAALVYVSTGGVAPTWNGTDFGVTGTQIGDTAVTLPGGTVGLQATTDAFASGGVYVVLFKAGNYAVSTTWLSYDDKIGGSGVAMDAITYNIQYPALGKFDPGFSGWTPVPEPSTLALLAIGAAAVACRRRKLS
jgi:hypothetical protein